jgi:hypothetical protein
VIPGIARAGGTGSALLRHARSDLRRSGRLRRRLEALDAMIQISAAPSAPVEIAAHNACGADTARF